MDWAVSSSTACRPSASSADAWTTSRGAASISRARFSMAAWIGASGNFDRAASAMARAQASASSAERVR
jgi:hypothetical protein